ncbi:hypothetical protein WA158_001475 [Blastocystis sp. Blastoise]
MNKWVKIAGLACGFLVSLYYGFGVVYFVIACILLMFMNLSDEPYEGLSAYSFLNPNAERIMGTVTPEKLQGQMYGIPTQEKEEYQKPKKPQEDPHDAALRKARELSLHGSAYLASSLKKRTVHQKRDTPSLNGPCPCGSGEKYKRCCGKKNKNDEDEDFDEFVE